MRKSEAMSSIEPSPPPARRDRSDYIGRTRAAKFHRRARILSWQAAIILIFLGFWEIVTRIPALAATPMFDPFFISRPSAIAVRMWEFIQPGRNSIWPHLLLTLEATFWGLLAGVASGFIIGLALSMSRSLADVLNPFIVALNSMPRIAFVPLITMFFGLGLASKVVTSWFVVFFLVFFNTYKGGLSVENDLINFCRTLRATRAQILWRVRIPTAAAWTFAALPNAISFALIGVVLAEFVGSSTGMGYLMILALSSMNATNMFAVIAMLSIVGLILVYSVTFVERRLLHWTAEHRDRE